ncbi:MAG: YbhB/YbcL family Raf kinase inhibitor-like protein [Patescibacteria group bacterium]
MKISSTAFKDGERIPEEYTCDGNNINPPLAWEEIPAETKSMVLIVEDPDSPSGTWTHWTLWNIPPDSNKIDENNFAGGAIEGGTTFGSIGYGGPCPGTGTHRYFFKLYALDGVVNLKRGALPGELLRAIDGRIIDKAELMGLYERKSR